MENCFLYNKKITRNPLQADRNEKKKEARPTKENRKCVVEGAQMISQFPVCSYICARSQCERDQLLTTFLNSSYEGVSVFASVLAE